MQQSEDVILAKALELPPGEARRNYLLEACGDRHEILQGVEDLLEAYDEGDFLENPAAVTWAIPHSFGRSTEPPGEMIGPYKIRELIGEGGFGLVYVAEQEVPLRRKVALKIIKPGMDSREIIARFEMERQALALMDHPNVAQVYDAGATPVGRPYFVMELVPGVAITRYCDSRKLDSRERLRLFRDVCRAVQHAHLKGVIHRDLKPSNVLVTVCDGEPVVKVIDFGVAKALHSRITEHSIYTSFGQMIGTPLYMSPEQAELNGLDVDTRSDIYSLGVLLYELLTGVTPFDRETFNRLSQDEFRRMIRETEPIHPSQRIQALDSPSQIEICRLRGLDLKRLRLDLQGDLDWIVMKALEKDRNRRYESAGELAADIDNFLNGDPIQARPPSTWYALKKRLYRHRVVVISAILIIASLIVGTAVSAWQAYRAIIAEHVAVSERDRALAAEQNVLRLLYAADIHRAAEAWEERDATRMHDALTLHLPRQGKTDLRGIEWHYLWNQKANISREIWKGTSSCYTVIHLPESRFAAGGEDGIIRIFDEQTGRLIRSLNSEQDELNSLVLSPDGQLLASAGDDGSIVMRRYPTLEVLWRTSAHKRQAFGVAFLFDGTALVSCGYEPNLRVWDTATGSLIREIPTGGFSLESVHLNHDNIAVVGANWGEAWWIDIESGEVIQSGKEKMGKSIATFSHSGKLAAVATSPGQVNLVDVEDKRRVIQTWQLPDAANSLAFCPMDRTLAVGDSSGAVHLLALPSWEESGSGPGSWKIVNRSEPFRSWQAHEHRVYALEFRPDGRSLLSGSLDGTLKNWKLDDSFMTLEIQEQVNELLFAPDSELLVLTQSSLKYATGPRSQPEFEGLPGHWRNFDVTTTSPFLLTSQRHGSRVFRVAPDFSSQQVLWSAEEGSFPLTVAISPTGQQFAVEVEPPPERRLNPESGRYIEIVQLPGAESLAKYPTVQINQLVYSPDGQFFGFLNSTAILLVDTTTGEIVQRLERHTSTVRQIAFHPEGRYLASVGGDRTMKVHDLLTGETVWSVIAHKVSANTVAFSADGRTLVTGGEDGILKFWRWDSRRRAFELRLSDRPIRYVRISPDQKKLAVQFRNYHYIVLDADTSGSPEASRLLSEDLENTASLSDL